MPISVDGVSVPPATRPDQTSVVPSMAGWPARTSGPSRRAKISAAALRWGIRPVLNHLTDSTLGVLAGRQLVAGALAVLSPPLPGTRIGPVDERGADGRVRGEWVRAEGVAEEPSDAEGCLYYLHGSGYAVCSPSTHRGITSRLSALTGLPVFSVDYRLAPRYRFPTAALDVERGWRWLTTRYHPAERIVVAGDSAGGHLAIDLCLALLRAGRPLPAAQALLSPVADLTLGLAGHREQLRPDPMISAATARRLIGIYTRDVDPTDARLAHVLVEGEKLPPTLIHAGGREMLAADAHHLARMLQAGGTRCQLRVWPGQMHVFQALVRLVPEAAEALAEVATFLLDALPPTCASSTDDGRAAGSGRRTGIRRSA